MRRLQHCLERKARAIFEIANRVGVVEEQREAGNVVVAERASEQYPAQAAYEASAASVRGVGAVRVRCQARCPRNPVGNALCQRFIGVRASRRWQEPRDVIAKTSAGRWLIVW